MYKRWADKSQDLNVEWSMDVAKQVLEAWQRSFTEVKENINCQRKHSAYYVKFVLAH